MTIDHNNIEIYLLDYLEGNLDPVITAELMAFLAENPEYEELIRDTRRYTVNPAGDRFPDAFSLKRDFKDIAEINSKNFDEFCIAASEGILGETDMERLKLYIGEDTLKMKNLELFNSLRLEPDLSIQFPGKSSLKKARGLYFPRRYFYYSLAVAASLAFIILLTLSRPGNNPDKPEPKGISYNTAPDASDEIEPPINTVPSPAVSNSSSHTDDRLLSREESPQIPVDKAVETESSAIGKSVANLAELSPITGKVQGHLKDSPLRPEVMRSKQEVHNIEPERQLHIESDNLFAGLLKRINFWKTAETAISGFNYLTEANVSINKVTDDQGRLTQLTLNTESYSIEGKIR